MSLHKTSIPPNQIEASERGIKQRLQRLYNDYMNRKITRDELITKGETALTNHYNKILSNVNKWNQKRGFPVQIHKYGLLWDDLEDAKQWWRLIARDMPMR